MCPSTGYGCGGINGEENWLAYDENHHRHGFHRYVSDDPQANCPHCYSNISAEVTFVAADKSLSSSASGGEKGSEGGGYVKDGVTYMVMDDLQVKPFPLVSSLSMLSTFNVRDNGALVEKTVSVGIS
ncbi:uncharacterized protein LOC125421480 [Ziziphus jujuba]|uniref:Uncharacterized protein LOC125421480 n=1 Tax=Ziziphus jujuba TaxID=326968 RepID=A0ABM3IEH2_ZIZJJ|nr:uncharacterized protein LOC125421480 [Ziziphus jujuba]